MNDVKRRDDHHYLPTLDGWRAVAIFMVILCHDSLHQLGPFSTSWAQRNGRSGVDIFFALSGLLICTRLLREEAATGSIHLRKFYIRRFFRIQPAQWTYLLVITLLMLDGVLDRAYRDILASLMLISNYVPVVFTSRDWYTGHFWSLAVEEHFYLMLPGFLLLVRRKRATILLIVSAILTLWIRLQWKYPALHFGSASESHTENAIVGIVIACACAVLLSRPPVQKFSARWLNPYAVLAITICLFLLHDYGNRLLGSLLLLCVWPLLLISTVLHPGSLPGRLLDSAPMRLIGRISYSLYLWQMLFFTHSGVVPVSHSRLLSAIQQSGNVRYVAVFLCAFASYYLVEKPFIQMGRRISSHSRTQQHDRRAPDTSELSAV